MALNGKFIGKTTNKCITIYALITAKASAATTSFCPRRVGSRAREARGRVRRGSLLDEGAADIGEVKFEKRRVKPRSNRPLRQWYEDNKKRTEIKYYYVDRSHWSTRDTGGEGYGAQP